MVNRCEIPNRVISAIDAMRGIFALFIALGHTYDIAKISSEPFISSLEDSIRACLGFQWVIGFFVISGFCIERSCHNASKQHFLKNYAIARFTRLAPLYYAILLITIISELFMFQSEYRPAYWTQHISIEGAMTQALYLQGAGILAAAFGAFASSFTITHEVFYYFYWGILREHIKRTHNNLQLTRVTLVSSIVFLLAYFLLKNFAYPMSLIFYYALPWLLGTQLYQHYNLLANHYIVKTLCSMWPLFLLLVLSGYAFGWATQRYWFLVLAMIFSMMIIQTNEETSYYSIFGNLSRYLGYFSYPLFLVHGPIAIFVAFLINQTTWHFEFHQLFFLLICSAIAGATLITYFVEKPWLIYRSLWLSGRFNREHL